MCRLATGDLVEAYGGTKAKVERGVNGREEGSTVGGEGRKRKKLVNCPSSPDLVVEIRVQLL